MAQTAVQAATGGAAFLARMAALEALREYAEFGVLAPQLDYLGAELTARLTTAEGQGAAGEWLRYFRGPLDALERYRHEYLHGAKVSEKDLQEADEAAAMALDALRRRLERV